MNVNDVRIVKAREIHKVDLNSKDVPDNVKKYIDYLETELFHMMYEAEYWCEKYVNEKGDSNEHQS